jgi:hypothetical protein
VIAGSIFLGCQPTGSYPETGFGELGRINDAGWLAGYSKTKKLASITAASEKVSARTRKSCPNPSFLPGIPREQFDFLTGQACSLR